MVQDQKPFEFLLLANLMNDDYCMRTISTNPENFCDESNMQVYIGGIVVICCFAVTIALEIGAVFTVCNKISNGPRLKYCKWLVSL